MPSRKQRRRELKSKRHAYEFVYVDGEGNELDEPPPELAEQESKRDKAVATTGGKKKPAPARGAGRVPPPPSWNRAVKRAALLGVVVFFLFSLTAGKAHNRYLAALLPAVIYTALFIPFTFMIDRFAYRRYEAKQAGGGAATPRPPKKR